MQKCNPRKLLLPVNASLQLVSGVQLGAVHGAQWVFSSVLFTGRRKGGQATKDLGISARILPHMLPMLMPLLPPPG